MRAIARARSDVRARARGERSEMDFAIVARRRRRRGAIGDGVDGANAMAAMAPPRDDSIPSESIRAIARLGRGASNEGSGKVKDGVNED